MGVHITEEEHKQRIETVRQLLADRGLAGLCLFGSQWIFYFTGFVYQPSERPVCILVPLEGEIGIMVPALEQDHVANYSTILSEVTVYPEYPGRKHPMTYLAEMIRQMGLHRAQLGCDSDGYGSYWGSHGPTLSTVLPEAEVVNLRFELEKLRMIKSKAEIAAIRESARFGHLVHRLLQESIRPGLTEVEIGQRVSAEATTVMLKAFGPKYDLWHRGGAPAQAGFKAGPDTALPHALPDSRSIQAGDLVVTWASAFVDGYHAELERTLILGAPTDKQRKYFDLMCEIQQLGFEALRPGRRCSDVDSDVQSFAQSRGLVAWTRHHTGHALGLEGHERPFLDSGDDTEIQPGMVFSIEPGLYVQGVGGFRHSDTLLVTKTGAECLTYYPRDLESLIIPV